MGADLGGDSVGENKNPSFPVVFQTHGEVSYLLNQEAAQSVEKIGGADFLVRIVFRQNATWQGEVQWLNTGRKKYFRSFLELTLLMNQCMEESAYPRSGYMFQSWDSPDEKGPQENEDKASQP